jgi:hypothetical protein
MFTKNSIQSAFYQVLCELKDKIGTIIINQYISKIRRSRVCSFEKPILIEIKLFSFNSFSTQYQL